MESHGCWISFPTLGLQLRRRKPSTPSSLRTTDVATMVSTLFLSGRRPCNPCKLPVVGSTELSTFKCTRVFISGWGTGQFPCTCRVLSLLVCTTGTRGSLRFGRLPLVLTLFSVLPASVTFSFPTWNAFNYAPQKLLPQDSRGGLRLVISRQLMRICSAIRILPVTILYRGH